MHVLRVSKRCCFTSTYQVLQCVVSTVFKLLVLLMLTRIQPKQCRINVVIVEIIISIGIIRYADCITFPPFGISYRGHVGRDVIDDQLPPYYLLRPWDIFITPSAEEDIARHEPS